MAQACSPRPRLLTLVLLLPTLGCPAPEDPTIGPKVRHDWEASTSGDPAAFWDAPFPSEHRRGDDGRPHLDGFPNPDAVGFVDDLVALAGGGLEGFGTTSAIFFRLEAEPRPASLPDLRGSLQDGAAVYLLDVERGERVPVTVRYDHDAGPFGATGLLSLLPLQGRPLRPGALHAAVVTRDLRTTGGERFGHHPALDALDGPAADALAGLPTPAEEVAGLAAFVTQDPEAELRAFLADLRARPLPALDGPFTPLEEHDGYCVFEATLPMPLYQAGEPPYDDGGGTLTLDAGVPSVQRTETARAFLTLPRTPPPAGGFPVATFVRTGGGGDRPLIDRGVRDDSGEPIEPGSGPARELAAIGVAGLQLDGPLGGLRNPTGGDEQFLVFNIANPGAMRDNIRQSALELTLVPDLLAGWTVDASSCGGLEDDAVTFDTDRLALIGHSMGATIAPLALALEPRFGAAVLSGAGGSWVHNVVHKQSPLEVRPLAEAILRYPQHGHALHEHDPALALLQWGGESADPPAWGPSVRSHGTHVLMVQGIVDTYILPPMANATSLSLGLDLGGPALDAEDPRLTAYEPLGDLLDLAGAEAVELPRAGVAGVRTGLVVQHAEDGVEDGHEVFFQLDAPKRQASCFLGDFAADAGPGVSAGDEGEPCPAR